jgi:outer membrane protein assembly factor BamD
MDNARYLGMKKLVTCLMALVLLVGCTQYAKVQKSMDYEYKYELAKAYYVQGEYSQASSLLEEVLAFMKGSAYAEESLFMLAMCYYDMGDYVTASHYLTVYFNTYPRGVYAETARFMSAKALFLDTPDPRLDQTSTIKAIGEIQVFTEYYPYSKYGEEAHAMLYELHDRLVEKEFRAAQLYYDLGNYMGNNYQSCIITAQNALNDYPYTKLREELSMLILRARYSMAKESVQEKMIDRYRDTEDEYYAFKNEFPDSKYMKEADKILRETQKALKK